MKQRSKMPAKAACGLSAFAAAMLFMLIVPHRAAAYVLEGPHILEFTAKAMGTITTLKIDQKLIVYPDTSKTQPAVFDETVIYRMPERFRSDVVAGQIHRTHLVVADTSLTVVDGRITLDENPFDLYQNLLRNPARSGLIQTLNRMGVETAISSLGRIDQSVVFVVGAHYPDASVCQLAVDQQTFLPIRLLLVDTDRRSVGGRLEIFYRKWKEVHHGWFPFQVVFNLNGRLAREIQVTDLQRNPSIPRDLLDLEALKASVGRQEPDMPQKRKQEAMEAVHKAMQDFQKKFE